MLHFINTSIGFTWRLLHDNCPVKGRHRAVGAEHGSPVFAIPDFKFLGGGELSFIALVHEVAHDFQVLHVLAGCVIGDGGSDQASLTVHNVRSQAATADFLQTANQELQVYDRPNHAQKAPAIHPRSAGASTFLAPTSPPLAT